MPVNTDETPDHVPCRHCGVPISWDEICWTHDDTGFATCGTIISGGTRSPSDMITVNPDIDVEGPHAGKRAEPVGAWS